MIGEFNFYYNNSYSNLYTVVVEDGSCDTCYDKAEAEFYKKHPTATILDHDERYYDEDDIWRD